MYSFLLGQYNSMFSKITHLTKPIYLGVVTRMWLIVQATSISNNAVDSHCQHDVSEGSLYKLKEINDY